MTVRADLVVTGGDAMPTLAVEVRARIGTDSDWAAQTRRNLIAHFDLGDLPYFMLVTPERLYLWQGGLGTWDRQPDVETPTAGVLAKYLEASHRRAEDLGDEALELAVAAWLSELAGGLSPSRGWLASSGLAAAVAGGRVLIESVA